MTLEARLLDQLRTPIVVRGNTSRFQTAFCVTVEARQRTTTGTSAHDRSRTIQALIDPAAKPYDFVKPGHMFPLRARAGGVLTRTGQTEASVDLARLAGLHPSGVICEIMKEDGTMARVPDLIPFCQKHGLLMVTVADLVAHRMRKEPLVKLLEVKALATRWGSLRMHRFQSLLDGGTHLAFVLGDLAGEPAPLVRVHLETLPEDLLGFGEQGGAFEAAMNMLKAEGRGALVYLRRHGRTQGVLGEQAPAPAAMSDRDFGVGAQILRQLGVGSMRLLSRHETRYVGLRGFGLDIQAHVHLNVSDSCASGPHA